MGNGLDPLPPPGGRRPPATRRYLLDRRPCLGGHHSRDRIPAPVKPGRPLNTTARSRLGVAPPHLGEQAGASRSPCAVTERLNVRAGETAFQSGRGRPGLALRPSAGPFPYPAANARQRGGMVSAAASINASAASIASATSAAEGAPPWCLPISGPISWAMHPRLPSSPM